MLRAMPDSEEMTKLKDPASASNQDAEEEEIPEGPAPTPFDHPLFLPVLLFGLMLWFGYDGFINTDPEMMEHQMFNRVGFGFLSAGTVYFGFKGFREWKEDENSE